MELKQLTKYLFVIDIMQNIYRRDRALMHETEERLGRPAIPIETGLETAVKILALRTIAPYEYVLKTTARVSGVDYLYNKFIRKINNILT